MTRQMRRVKTIIIAGYYGFGNLGDEAIRVALRAALNEREGLQPVWLVPQSQNTRTSVRHLRGAAPFSGPYLRRWRTPAEQDEYPLAPLLPFPHPTRTVFSQAGLPPRSGDRPDQWTVRTSDDTVCALQNTLHRLP
jgi:hypothetical protein